jgi:hypothetical protein
MIAATDIGPHWQPSSTTPRLGDGEGRVRRTRSCGWTRRHRFAAGGNADPSAKERQEAQRNAAAAPVERRQRLGGNVPQVSA